MAREVGSDEAVASVMQGLGWDRINQGLDGWDLMREALRRSRQGGFQRDAARGYTNLYQLAVDQLRIAEYEWVFVEGDEYNLECEMPTYTWCLRGSRGTAFVRLGRLAGKLAAFGLETREVDGHNQAALDAAIGELWHSPSPAPRALVARTVKGKGVSFMEGDNRWHYTRLSDATYAAALAELIGG